MIQVGGVGPIIAPERTPLYLVTVILLMFFADVLLIPCLVILFMFALEI
jgi:hypothetical protein